MGKQKIHSIFYMVDKTKKYITVRKYEQTNEDINNKHRSK